MFFGSCRITRYINWFTFAISLVTIPAQDPKRPIFFIDLIQTLFCWSSVIQAFEAVLFLTHMEIVEKMLGDSAYLSLLIYCFIFYLPVFAFMVFWKGIEFHFPLIIFVFFGDFVYYSLNVPVSDGDASTKWVKFAIAIIVMSNSSISFLLPCLVSLLLSFFAETLFERDDFGITKFLSRLIDGEDDTISRTEESQTGILPDTNVNDEAIHQLVEMGYSESDARRGLQMTDGNVESAVNYLADIL